MTFIKSISGFRGTIGGPVSENFTPIDIVKNAAAFGIWVKEKTENPIVVVGRDARISGSMVSGLVCNTLIGLGIDVIDLGLTTTPTVEMIVPHENATAGIIITASHNPKEWNALKFVNEKGEFISAADGERIIHISNSDDIEFARVTKLGSYREDKNALAYHIEEILKLPEVAVEAIQSKKYTVVVDAVNSAGAIALPPLLAELGCETILINGEPTGQFAHNPEPLPDNLGELAQEVLKAKADLGIAVDPDVDRIAFVSEDGSFFGEEYTLVAVADYVLSQKKGTTVSNLSSTRALRDVTEGHGQEYHAAAVGEVNVVKKMKEVNAVIGGEGNGGVIYPGLHYGRDAILGAALFLSLLATRDLECSNLRKSYSDYVISKNKIELTPDLDLDKIFALLIEKYSDHPQNTIDGLKIEFDTDWVHLRRSNTEPIIRIYAESTSEMMAENLANKIKKDIGEIINA